MNILTNFFDFFLPRFCPSCKTKLNPEEIIGCTSCLSKIKRPSEERIANEYHRKFHDANIISGFASLYIFEKEGVLQHLIHGLKYDGKFRIGTFLGRQTAFELKQVVTEWNPGLVIPVPLHHLKKAERGFNQSYYIAKGFCSEIRLPLKTNLLKRKKFTESQTSLTLAERASNIHGAFSAREDKFIRGKNILLLDDVITTGATISECGRVLLEKGAGKIYAVSIAIAD
jgi:ComF family protein